MRKLAAGVVLACLWSPAAEAVSRAIAIKIRPPGTVVAQSAATECDHSWTFGPVGETLRDNVNVGGIGSQYRCYEGQVWTLGDDSNWWKFSGGVSGVWSLGPMVPAYTALVNQQVTVVGDVPDKTGAVAYFAQASGVNIGPIIQAAAVTTGQVLIPFALPTLGERLITMVVRGCNVPLADGSCDAAAPLVEKTTMPITLQINDGTPDTCAGQVVLSVGDWTRAAVSGEVGNIVFSLLSSKQPVTTIITRLNGQEIDRIGQGGGDLRKTRSVYVQFPVTKGVYTMVVEARNDATACYGTDNRSMTVTIQ